jgi:hypothetical protein
MPQFEKVTHYYLRPLLFCSWTGAGSSWFFDGCPVLDAFQGRGSWFDFLCEGAPRVGFTRGGLYPNRGTRSRQRIKTGNIEIKSPTRKTDAWATQFILSLGVRATRRPYPSVPSRA